MEKFKCGWYVNELLISFKKIIFFKVYITFLGQVANMIHESERELRRGFINTSHIRIPAAYSSGITLVIKIDAPFCNLLKQCPELPEFHNGDNVETLNENT